MAERGPAGSVGRQSLISMDLMQEGQMDRNSLQLNMKSPISRAELVTRYCRGKKILDIGCVQHNSDNAANPLWLHKILADAAESVVGVDYLADEVDKLRAKGYKMVAADVTKPIPLDGPFDVIVVGNLIEHLSNFDGLFENMRRLLADDGVVLISTCNPFYREQYFYSAFHNDIMVNPEHTCWIDPVTLDQLAQRYGFGTEAVQWMREKWQLWQLIGHRSIADYNIFNERWEFPCPPRGIAAVLGCVLATILRWIKPQRYASLLRSYDKDLPAFLYLKFMSSAFKIFWVLYRTLIITSDINKHETYMSVLRLKSKS